MKTPRTNAKAAGSPGRVDRGGFPNDPSNRTSVDCRAKKFVITISIVTLDQMHPGAVPRMLRDRLPSR
jgi:hypothetical protein